MIRRTTEEHRIDSLLYEKRCHIFHTFTDGIYKITGLYDA